MIIRMCPKMKQIKNCKVMKGAFGTFRPGGKHRHFGRKGITEHINITEIPKSNFERLGCFADNPIKFFTSLNPNATTYKNSFLKV